MCLEISLSKKAVKHIENIVSSISNYRSWLENCIDECKLQSNIISKRVDFESYINCIVSTIDNFIFESQFNYENSILPFSDEIVVRKLEKGDFDNDFIIMLCFLNYISGQFAIDLIENILDQFQNQPNEYKDNKLIYSLYLWKKDDKTDVDFIKDIMTYYVNFLKNTKLKYYDSLSEMQLEDLQCLIETILSDQLKKHNRNILIARCNDED